MACGDTLVMKVPIPTHNPKIPSLYTDLTKQSANPL